MQAFLIASALAQPVPQTLPEIVVTGRGLGEARGERVYAASEIGRERLAGSASNRLEDVLRDVPGFQMFRRSDSRSANPTSQGVTLRALGGNAASRALLVLDGVPQTDPFGGWVAWPAYDPRRLGRARVVRGGGSGAEGAGALAGTILLDSAGPAELDGPHGSIAYGSRDAFDMHAGLGARIGAGFLAVSVSHMRGDGFTPIVAEQSGAVDRSAPFAQSSLAARAALPVGAGIELQAATLLFRDRRDRGTDFSEIGSDGADASLRLVGADWSALAYVQTRDFSTSFASVSADRASVTRVSNQYAVPATGLGARGEWRPRLGALDLRLGADWRATEGRTQELYQFVAGEATRSRIAGGAATTIGAFAEASRAAGPLTLTAGGRLDHWRLAGGMLRERLLADGAVLADIAYPDRSGWRPTGRAGAALDLGSGLSARAAAYLGWRLPTLNELYRPFRVGQDATAANPALAPERLRGIEAGVDVRPAPDARLGLTLYASRLEDGIANVTLGEGPGTFPGVGFVAGAYRQRRNIDAIDARGIELDGAVTRGAFTLSGGYALARARVRAGGPAAPLDGLRPAQTPRHSASATLAWDQAGARAAVTARYVSSQFEDDLNRQALKGAFTADAVLAVPMGRGLTLEARAENLADSLVVAQVSTNGVTERAAPRTLWLGLRFGG